MAKVEQIKGEITGRKIALDDANDVQEKQGGMVMKDEKGRESSSRKSTNRRARIILSRIEIVFSS